MTTQKLLYLLAGAVTATVVGVGLGTEPAAAAVIFAISLAVYFGMWLVQRRPKNRETPKHD